MVGRGWNPAYGPPGSRPASSGLALGTAAALVAALVGAVLWAVTVEITGYELGFAAVGVGLLVGQTAALTAGASRRLPVVAAVLALVGCALGDLFVDAHEVAKVIGMGTPAMVRFLVTHPDVLVDVFKAGFHPLSLAFWGIAAGAAYRLAARGLVQPDLRPMARAVIGPDFNGRAPAPEAPAAPVPPRVLAQHPSDFFSQPSAPRLSPQARQAALADQGLLQPARSPEHSTSTVHRPARTI